MLAEFSIFPLDETHLSKDVARVIEALEGTGLQYRLGPMGTSIEGECDRLIYLHTPEAFWAIGPFYEEFEQISDEQVVDLLRQFAPATP